MQKRDNDETLHRTLRIVCAVHALMYLVFREKLERKKSCEKPTARHQESRIFFFSFEITVPVNWLKRACGFFAKKHLPVDG